MRNRARLALALGLFAVAAYGLSEGVRFAERQAAVRVWAALAAHRLNARAVRVPWNGPVEIAGLGPLQAPETFSVEKAEVRWGLRGGRDARSHVRGVTLHGLRVTRGAVTLEWPRADFEVRGWTREASGERLSARQPGGGALVVDWSRTAGGTSVTLEGRELDLGGARVTVSGAPVLAPGRWTGRVKVARNGEAIESDGNARLAEARLATPPGLDLGHGPGAATTAHADWSVRHLPDATEVRRLAVRLDGLALDARGRVAGAGHDRAVDLEASLQAELAGAFRTFGVSLPPGLDSLRGKPLGTARLEVSARGPLADPATLRVVPRLTYEPEPSAAASLAFLQRPFRIAAPGRPGLFLEVNDAGGDFVPLEAVPPLFLRALLISEDAGFYGHPGVDVAEIPVAWAENAERGTPRGASTITQQLVKNLFLSPEKTYGRKILEAALALVLDSGVPKARVLEIYLNVIEWGPGFHGLVPAARHYFGKSPAELSPKEIAFLVCLIPSPVRYHQAHTAGRPGPGMEQLMAGLLVKLHSVGALSDVQLEDALAEQLVFRPEDASRVASSAG